MQTKVILKMTTLFSLVPLSSSLRILARHFSDLEMSSLAKLLHYFSTPVPTLLTTLRWKQRVSKCPGSLQVW